MAHELVLKRISCLFFVFVFFRQEGWRLEHENPTDSSSRLVFKGVVFNEMKGVFVRTPLCFSDFKNICW